MINEMSQQSHKSSLRREAGEDAGSSTLAKELLSMSLYMITPPRITLASISKGFIAVMIDGCFRFHWTFIAFFEPRIGEADCLPKRTSLLQV